MIVTSSRQPTGLVSAVIVFGALLILPFATRAEAGSPVTFNEQIAPIIYQNCSMCHRPGEAAPFSLLSYHDVVRKAKTIAKATGTGAMPPWKAEPASYEYRDERRLTPEQIALIQAWVAQGTPEGDPSDKPEPPKFTSGWRLGEPDLLVEMPAAYHVPADGPDIYRNIAVPLGIKEDKWVTAIDLHPTARAAVHHTLYFADDKGLLHKHAQEGSEPGFSGMRAGGASIGLGGWAVGRQPQFFPDGLALNVPKGSDLVVQYHFHPTGKPEAEKSLIGLYFAKQAPHRMLMGIPMPPCFSLFSDLDISAGDKDFVICDSYTLPVAVDAVGVIAHAHYLATKLNMKAILPNGDVKTLLAIKDWDFAWQDQYFFKDYVPLPTGTKLDVDIHWDNSADNPHNPSIPPIHVRWGEETKDEMGGISLIVVAHDEANSPSLKAAIVARTRAMAVQKMQADPVLAKKVLGILAE
jgi:mono/diheme cytochrome c family protein